jgi:integration host factor subunit beta
MNKLELTETLREKTDLTKSEAKAVVKLFFKEMSNALAKGDRVEIRGLCSFYIKKYKAYAGRNPKTGEPTRVKPKKLPFFKVGKELRKRVNS